MKFTDIKKLNEEEIYNVDLVSVIDSDVLFDLNLIGNIFKQNGFEVRIVGGSVRDILLGTPADDIDLATNATPNVMMDFLKSENYQVIPTGLQHGTITVLGKTTKEPFEITTLRIDVDTDGRHANVEFTKDWSLDANRRDFTYNALYMELDGTVHDYTGGHDALMNKKTTQFVGSADERIKEDYLRILRWFRFMSRYGHDADIETKEAIARNADGLKQISGERIWKEVAKIVSGNNPELALNVMKETGVDKIIGLPINVDELIIVRKHTDNPVTAMVALSNVPEDIDHFVNDWKWSGDERDLAFFLMDNKYENFSFEIAKDMLVDGVSRRWVVELAFLKDMLSVAKQVLKWKIPVFPVSGKDLIVVGVNPGPNMGDIIRTLRSKWKQSDFSLTKNELLKMIE